MARKTIIGLIVLVACVAGDLVRMQTRNGTLYTEAEDFVFTAGDGRNMSLVALENERSASLVSRGLIATLNTTILLTEASLGASVEATRTALSTAVVGEQTRAVGVENNISSAVSTERVRALAAEQSIAAVTSGAIVAEQQRATTAETAINASLVVEISRAVLQDSVLLQNITTERSRALVAESSVATVAASAIIAEQQRATTAETSINASLFAEIFRAVLQDSILLQNITTERSRALVAETSVATVAAGATNTEQLRAVAVENALSASVSLVSGRLDTNTLSLSTAISGEISRATAAAQVLTTNLGSLSTRVATQLTCAQQGLVLLADGVTCGATASPTPSYITVFTLGSTVASLTPFCTGPIAVETVSGLNLCRRTSLGAGCASMYVNPGRLYSAVTGFVTMYQRGTPDGFASNEAVTIWSGNNLLYTYAMGYCRTVSSSAGNCPAFGGAGPTGSAAATGNWNCGSGTVTPPASLTAFFTSPIFGSTMPFTVNVPLTAAQLEVRICTDQPATDENIYLGVSSLSVYTPPLPLTSVPFTNLLSLTASSTSCAQGGWVFDGSQCGLNLCKRSITVAGCRSIWVTPTAPYTQVTGSVTILPFLTLDGFSGGNVGGDGVTFWSGNTLLWAYAVYGTPAGCPGSGPSVISVPTNLNGQWSCSNSATSPNCGGSLYTTPLFGPASAFTVQLPAQTQATIEIRICVDQARTDEDLYVSAASVSVR